MLLALDMAAVRVLRRGFFVLEPSSLVFDLVDLVAAEDPVGDAFRLDLLFLESVSFAFVPGFFNDCRRLLLDGTSLRASSSTMEESDAEAVGELGASCLDDVRTAFNADAPMFLTLLKEARNLVGVFGALTLPRLVVERFICFW